MHFVVNGVDELFLKSHRPLVSVHANCNSVNIHSVKLYICSNVEGRLGMSDVSSLYGISGLSFDSFFLSPLSFFCLVQIHKRLKRRLLLRTKHNMLLLRTKHKTQHAVA